MQAEPVSFPRATWPHGAADPAGAAEVDSNVASGLTAVEGVSGLISDLFFENKAHRDAVAVFRDTLERERAMSAQKLEETHMTLDAWRSQFVTVQEENTRLRQLGTIALRQLQDEQRRAAEAEALLREVSASIGPGTLAVLDRFRRVKSGLRQMQAHARTLMTKGPLRPLAELRRQMKRLQARLPGSELRRQISTAAE